MGKFGHKMREWREAWMSRNIPALDEWWGQWRPQPGAINREDTAPRTGEVSVAELKEAQAKAQAEEDDDATLRMRSLRRSEPVSGVDCRLPLDSRGKPYLRMSSDAPTEQLVPVAVTRFYRLTGAYPSIIFLPLRRYRKLEAPFCIVGKLTISIENGGLVDYDIYLKRY